MKDWTKKGSNIVPLSKPWRCRYCSPTKTLQYYTQTGTGKTLAFLTATFNHLLTTPEHEGRKPTQPRAIIMAPTRELAIQIFNDAEPLIASTGLKAALAYGGESYDKQLAKLQDGVDILIGTTVPYHRLLQATRIQPKQHSSGCSG